MSTTALTAACSAVVNRLGDLGLRSLADQLQRATKLFQMRFVCERAILSAEAIRIAATHFGQRPIVDFATELESAGVGLRAAIDARYEECGAEGVT